MTSVMQKTRRELQNPVIKRNLLYNVQCHGICQILNELIKSRVHLNQIMIWTSICEY